MPEYLDGPKTPIKSPRYAGVSEARDPLKRCGHAVEYRCCCAAHEDAEQDSPDCYDELTMNPGYRLCRGYGKELHGDE